ncbi:MAG: calcineurin-like phosphoesterase family protein [Alistipes sp.]|nr:calcineurin-like phosphoesterase family protein [Alistipes sp.]
MKRKDLLGLWMAAALLLAVRAAQAQDYNVRGTVLCDGKPVAGAVVSDGERTTLTDAAGNYGLHSTKNCGYVFLSVPAGYEVEADGLIPRHFVPLAGEPVDRADFELKRAQNDRYTLFVLNDIHLTNTTAQQDIRQFREKFVPDFSETLRTTPGKRYALTLGDMTTDSRWYRNNFGLPEYLAEMERVPGAIPIYNSMGNHDNDPKGPHALEEWDSVAVKTYRRVIGPNYYSFNLGRVHYVMLDNIVYLGPRKMENGKTRWDFKVGVDRTQLEWLERDLSHVKKTTPLVVCMHAPLVGSPELKTGRAQLNEKFTEAGAADELLEKLAGYRKVLLLTGHTHVNRHYLYSKRLREHNNIAVAASSWKLYGEGRRHMAKDGTPGGYAIYRVDGKKITWSYKALGLPVDSCQFRAYDMNTVPERYGGKPGSNEVWINVFNYDPAWKVTVREKGRRIRTERISDYDPLYRCVSEGEVPVKGTAFSPARTEHLFRAVTAEAQTPLEIEVRDGFGRTWRQTLERPKPFGWQMR